MVCATSSAPVPKPDAEGATPHSDVAVFLIRRNYEALGADPWDSRRVQLLCAKLGDTRKMMAARLCLRPADFERRMVDNTWTPQDSLICAMLDREIDLIRGIGRAGNLIGGAP